MGYEGLPPITISPNELMALHCAKSHRDYLQGTPFTDDLESLIVKVEAALSDKILNHLARIDQAFLPRTGPLRGYAEKKAILALIAEDPASLAYGTAVSSAAGV